MHLLYLYQKFHNIHFYPITTLIDNKWINALYHVLLSTLMILLIMQNKNTLTNKKRVQLSKFSSCSILITVMQ